MRVPVTELKMMNTGLSLLQQAETKPKKTNKVPKIDRGRHA